MLVNDELGRLWPNPGIRLWCLRKITRNLIQCSHFPYRISVRPLPRYWLLLTLLGTESVVKWATKNSTAKPRLIVFVEGPEEERWTRKNTNCEDRGLSWICWETTQTERRIWEIDASGKDKSRFYRVHGDIMIRRGHYKWQHWRKWYV
jgi:hypothetical protein